MKLRFLRKRLLLLLPASLLALGAGAAPADAAVDMHLKFSNAIDGESTDTGHGKEVDVLAWSWGASRTSATRSKAAGVALQELSFTKYVDRASPKLLKALYDGSTIDSATLTANKAATPTTPYLRFCMSDVRVNSMSTGGSGGEDRFTENVTLGFRRLTFEYTPDSAVSPVFASYDLSSGSFTTNGCPS
ncbi:MAG: type secretion system secreted protein Hcp [Thermoleophilaceae bacterium]|jgi:type VI secretion system secreted protein Hcp|nr:type secretion system secreted protein Hcp [Thermoleophilaceae bacterium]